MEVNRDEKEYLNLVKRIIDNGERRSDRTGTGTLSVFAPPQLRFSLRNRSFPLLTTKRVALRLVFEELLWLIRGQTDSEILSKKNVKIWDKNGSKQFLESVGLYDRREGDLGPVYGFQWRHFGAKYTNADADYTNKGVDQLKNILQTIKSNPSSRRLVLSAWNASDISIMALPPCHVLCQFYVGNLDGGSGSKPTLSCQLYQRSCDMGLGVPFNISSYSLLTTLIAWATGLEAEEFVHCMGDAHVYLDHIDPLKQQISREPRSFPKIYINTLKKPSENASADEMIKAIESLEFSDIRLENYNPYAKIEMNMST